MVWTFAVVACMSIGERPNAACTWAISMFHCIQLFIALAAAA